jgi:predicted Zn-dependent protease
MTVEAEQTTDPGVKPPIILPPWLVVLAALIVYGVTLNHWVTSGSLPIASQITGWDWHPGPLPWRPAPQYHPLTLIVTFPLRLLPMAWRVGGLNVLTAACAALTLGILARSVRLLPHNRTVQQLAVQDRAAMSMGEAVVSLQNSANEELLRGGGKGGLLSVRAAFLPAVFAVLLLGAQLTFWENAVSGTGEMIDLLVFAFLILCLLEFRISQRDRWLYLFAFVYGAGAANNWALIGFSPCFLVAVIWVKRLGIFNWRFVLRMIGLLAFGLLFYGLIPLMGAAEQDGSFWTLLHQTMAEQHIFLARMPRYYLLIASLPTLIPLLFAAINWPLPEGQFSIANSMARMFFRLLHILCLAVAALMFFDVILSPSPRARFGLGVMGGPGFLTFYYLAALAVGYFGGYILLVFDRIVPPRFGQATELIRAFNKGVLRFFWAAAVASPVILLYVNFQHIRDFNRPVIADFAEEMAKSLPAESAIVLADEPGRLHLAKGAAQRLGLPGQYIFVDSQSLPHGQYLRYLVDQYPAFNRELVNPERFPKETTSRQISLLLAHLARRQPVYYLHPSYGPYFEQACMTPNRLGEDLHPNPSNSLSTLVLAPAEIITNQAFWRALEKGPLAALPELAERNADARRIANFYSQMLDCWGTELQKAATELKLSPSLKDDMLTDANDQFAEAFRLNTNNIIASANQQYNAQLRGIPPGGPPIDLSELAVRCHNHWDTVLSVFGPADVPALDIQIGQHFAEHGIYLQAAHLFQRSLELAPRDPVGELDLAKIYIDLGLVDAALAFIKDIRGRSTVNPLELVRVAALAYVSKNDFEQVDKLLTDELTKDPKDQKFDGMTAEFYRLMGYGVLRESKRDPAKEATADKDAAIWFKKALTAYEAQLQLLNVASPNPQDIYDINLRKAEIQMTTKDFDSAIVTLDAMIRQNPDKPVPLLNRAISELKINRLDAAKKDYLAVEKMVPEPWQIIYYDLAEIAQRQNDAAEEILYDRLYLKYAPSNTPQFTNVTQRLHKLEGH